MIDEVVDLRVLLLLALAAIASPSAASTTNLVFTHDLYPVNEFREPASCVLAECELAAEVWWGSGLRENSLRLEDMGTFRFRGASVDIQTYGFMRSGATENPWNDPRYAHLGPGDFNDESINRDLDYENWVSAGSQPVDIFYGVTGLLRGSHVFTQMIAAPYGQEDGIPLGGTGRSILGHYGSAKVNLALPNYVTLDELRVFTQLPPLFETASFVHDRRGAVAPSSTNCWYGCGTVIMASDFQIAAVPLPSSVLLLLASILSLGGSRHMARKSRGRL